MAESRQDGKTQGQEGNAQGVEARTGILGRAAVSPPTDLSN